MQIFPINTIKSLISTFTILSLLLTALAFPLSASANTPRYAGELVYSTGNQSLLLEPGQTFKVAVSFQNTGSLTWDNTSQSYISIYTFEPRYRESLFHTNTWSRQEQPGRMEESRVAPGQRGTIYFDFTAPQKPGTYKETFHLAAEDTAWVTGGLFSYIIEVREPRSNPVAENPTSEKTTEQNLTAELQAISSREIRTRAGTPINMQARIKNTSNTTWNNLALQYANLNIASGESALYSHPTWQGSTVTQSTQTIASGESATISFFLQAPDFNGRHLPKFQLLANNQETNLFIELPVEVTGGNNQLIPPPPINQEKPPVENIEENKNLIDEPHIRIGVLIVDEETNDEVIISAKESGLTLENLSGEALLRVPANSPIRAWYRDNQYFFEHNGQVRSSTEPIRFVPGIVNAPLSVDNFDRRATRNSQFADNTFRNILEMRYNSHRDRIWLINELPIEKYLRGLVETSDLSPMEYQKATITAARTFATYHMTRNYKWPREFFHITAYSWDQVYNGYERELRSPRIVQAVNATRGEVITYENEVVLTPYFSRSDGRTRNWGDVLNGSAPWAVSVPVPCDVGRTLWGHGVGMSLSGAICMAGQGMNSEEILKHFYTGIDITQKW